MVFEEKYGVFVSQKLLYKFLILFTCFTEIFIFLEIFGFLFDIVIDGF